MCKKLRVSFAIVFCGFAAGCNGSFSGFVSPALESVLQEPISELQTKYHASDEDVLEGLKQFHNSAFGLAQERFQRAVERSPKDLTAWLGLAASYDRIRRFDLADRAYVEAARIGGANVTIINNRGYSYLLRGDVASARRLFLEAYAIEPFNPAVVNNLRLLDGSRKYVRRLDAAY